MPELAEYLVQIEIDGHAPGVDGPVDAVRILPDKVVWTRRKQGCPAAVDRGAK
jgi:hypothetical protein